MGEIQRKCSDMLNTESSGSLISSGEYCTIETAKIYGIFGGTTYFNTTITEAEANNIEILTSNKLTNKDYALCSLDNTNTAIQNCVLSTKNPWKTADETNKICMLPYNISLPDQLKYLQGSGSQIQKPSDIPIWKYKKDCIQEKWYDWFSIPDYHLGNKYGLSSNSELNLKPCRIGFVPNTDNPNRCVSKNHFQNGFFAGTFPYLPISLIHLLGSTKSTLMRKYANIMDTNNSNLTDATINTDIFNYLLKDKYPQAKLYEDIKNDIRPLINNLLNLPYDDRNVTIPFYEPSKMINNPITINRLEEAYSIALTFANLSSSSNNTNFIAWQQELADISGNAINTSKFHKQLLTLKKACDLAFNNATPYSKDILANLNIGKTDVQVKYPLKFKITDDERIMALSKNISQNRVTVDNATMQRRSALLNEKTETVTKLSEDKLELNKIEYDPLKYDDAVHKEVLENPVDNTISNVKTLITVGVFAVLCILFFGILYIIASVLWEPLADFANNVILGIYYAIFTLKDMLFRSKFDPPSLNKNLIEVQKEFLNKKINKDMKKYALNIY